MIKILLAALTAFLFIPNATAQSEKIKWQIDYKEALALSRKTEKPILIDFWAKWCEPCRVMDEQFWTRPDVVKAVKSFVPLKINYEEQRELAKQFVVSGLPYTAFSDPFGSLVTFRKGFGTFNAEDINQIAGSIPKDFAVLSKAFTAVELKKDDGAALLEIADYYSKNNMPTASSRFYELAYRTPEIQRNVAQKESVHFKWGRQFYAAGSFQLTAYTLEDYLKFYPTGASREDAYATIVSSYVKLRKLDEAEKYLGKLKKEFPASKNIEAAARDIEKAKSEAKE